MLERGYLVIGRFAGASIRLHWSVLVGMLVLTRFRIAPGDWLGFLVVILVHELGHAFLATRLGMLVVGIDVHGFGGQCACVGSITRREHAIIAWGGVAAQAALLAATLVVLAVVGWPEGGVLAELVDALTWTNAAVIALNLLPVPPLDGAEAWKLFSRSGRRR